MLRATPHRTPQAAGPGNSWLNRKAHAVAHDLRAVFAGEVRKVFYFDEKVGSVSGEIAIESSHED